MTTTPSPYGSCPVCGSPGISRERRPNGNDKCANGHVYKSSASITRAANTALPDEDIRQLVTDLERGGMNEYFDPVACARGILTLVDVLEAEKVALATERDTLVVECKRMQDALQHIIVKAELMMTGTVSYLQSIITHAKEALGDNP